MSVTGINLTATTIANLKRTNNLNNNADFAGLLSSSKNSGIDLDSIFQAASKKYNVPVNLLKAVAKVESNFHPNATSRCGAMGIMQLMPRTAKWLGVTDAYDPEQNIMGGAKYLSKLLNQYNGDVGLTLAAYNAGPGTVRKYGGIPPFAQGYVNKVLKNCGGEFQAGSVLATSSSCSASEITMSVAADDSSDGNLASLLLQNAIHHIRLSEDIYVQPEDRNDIFNNREQDAM